MAKPKRPRSTGIMNKMRDKMPLIIIFLIVAFLGTIIFEWGMNYLGLRTGGEKTVFGKVNGQEINPQDYTTEVNKRIKSQLQQSKKSNLDEQSEQQIRDQVWNEYVSKVLLDQQCSKLGISVTDEEITDWVYNSPETLPEALKKYFTDSTGQFRMDIYEQALKDTRAEVKEFWVAVEEYLRQTLTQSKLYTVIAGAAGVSEGEVIQKYKDDNIKMNFDYVLLDVNSMTDTSLNNATEEELKNYYDKNKDEYKQEEAVKFKYVIFSDAATLDDSVSVKKDLESLIDQLKTSTIEDSSLINLLNDYSSAPYDTSFQKPSAISQQSPKLVSFLFSAKKDDVSDVIIDQDAYHLARLLDTREGDETFTNAEHILISFGTDSAAAKKKAEDIYKKAKRGDNFGDLVMANTDDTQSKATKGDLGWFGKGRMVKEFEEACNKANVGEIVGPVKTQFGYHIIKVKGKSKKEFKFADIKKTVTTSSTTRSIVKDRVQEFYKNIDKGVNFDSLAISLNMTPLTTPEINKTGTVPSAVQSKSIIAFGLSNDVSKVEKPVKAQGGYAVYQIIQRIPEGYKNFDSVKITMIKPKVISEKKFKALENYANDAKNRIQNNDLNSLISFNPQLKVEKADSVSVNKPSPNIGQDYVLYNNIMNLKPGEISAPIKGIRGYYIVKLKEITNFDQNDYNAKAQDIRKQLLSSKQQSSYQEWMSVLQANADIIDNRDMLN